jgi:hypothetical protein
LLLKDYKRRPLVFRDAGRQRGLMVPANFAGAMPSSHRADA